MEIIKNLNGASGVLSQVPEPPKHLTTRAKYWYKHMAKRLITEGRLKEIYLDALEGYADGKAVWEFACSKIREADLDEYGSGYTQKFSNGVIQNSQWVNMQNRSWKRIVECCKMFGLDPHSEKALSANTDPAQGNLFEGFKSLKSGG